MPFNVHVHDTDTAHLLTGQAVYTGQQYLRQGSTALELWSLSLDTWLDTGKYWTLNVMYISSFEHIIQSQSNYMNQYPSSKTGNFECWIICLRIGEGWSYVIRVYDGQGLMPTRPSHSLNHYPLNKKPTRPDLQLFFATFISLTTIIFARRDL